jgi:diguanylate cyclase (GGDEF)-like protein
LVAATLVESVRPYDVVSRWGGDEFLLLFGHVTAHQLEPRARTLCRLVGQSSLAVHGSRLAVKMSVGATMARPGDSQAELVARADRLMYESKSAGGDRVTLG